MRLITQYKRLTYWNKLGFLGSIVSILALILSIVAFFTAGRRDHLQQEKERLKTLSYRTQVEKLDQTEVNVKSLLEFIEHQRDKLKQSEDLLHSLRQEHEKLKPLLEVDRKVVDAIFDAQEQRIQSNETRQRWIGFGLGILASLSASGIWFLSLFVLKRLKTVDAPKKHEPNRTQPVAPAGRR